MSNKVVHSRHVDLILRNGDTWKWTYVWCGHCNTEIVNLGRAWITHTMDRPWCIPCFISYSGDIL